ncbi:VOC family protein [Ferrimonas lipolytica]|uniref:VOC family protein n=1 Tax=Ferrimonas lipolytica TaxID=2724191 RepID=A0A6H1UD31_9GAMM|nr:VOC family protein [Ferrimonas lipolytica]QIZ76116.1 VOC family protein [Ferrimonas lipolytica]
MTKAKVGEFLWQDLTVANADGVADFYAQVVGWEKKAVPMGDYSDHGMMVADEMKAGICHNQGENAAIPPQWLLYVAVADLATSVATVSALGGKILVAPKAMGEDQFAVIEDPAGAVLALYQQA